MGEPWPHGTKRSTSTTWLFAGLFLLTATTGMVDATSFLGLGQVFTANMTGNVLLLGFAAASSSARAAGLSVGGSFISLAAFTVGAFGGSWVTGRRGTAIRIGRALAVEWVVLAAAVVVVGIEPHPMGDVRSIPVALLALSMGVQNALVRRMGIPDANTTVLTTALGGLAADAVEVGGRPVRAGRRTATIVLIFLGAGVGALAVHYGLIWSTAGALALLTVASFALFNGRPEGTEATP